MTDFNNGSGPSNQPHYSPPPPPGYQPQWTPMPQPPKKTNGKSIAGLVLGICAIIVPYAGFIIGIIGIFLSSIALKEIKKSDEQGKGMAVAGLVCSIVGTVFYGVLIAALIILFFIGINVGSEYNEYNSNYNFGIANDFE